MVIDSGIFIEHFRSKDKSATTFARLPEDELLWVSVVVIYELLRGVTVPEKIAEINSYLKDIEVLDMTIEIAEQSAEIYKDLKRRGLLIDNSDIFIAATCLVYDLPLKILNRKDFDRIPGLRLA